MSGLLLTAQPSGAADMVVKAVPVVLPTGWTGFYGGFHAGYGQGKNKWVDNFPTLDGEIDATPKVDGVIAGLQGGFNFQANWLLLGIEGDFSWSKVKNSEFDCFFFGDQLCSSRSEWFGSVAGRVGIVNGDFLLYGKGGVAWAYNAFTDLATCAGSQPISRAGIPALCGQTFFGSEIRPGWLIGGGLEYRFARNWSVKAEYNFMDFGDRSVGFFDDAGNFFTEEIHNNVHIVKAGLNYHFNGAYAGARTSNGSGQGEEKVINFIVADVSKDSAGGAIGTFIAPYANLDVSGLRFYLVGEGGKYKYPVTNGYIHGVYLASDIMAGYAFEGNNYSINLLGGLNVQQHYLSELDPTNKVQGVEFGAKVRGDAWINPTPATLTYAEAEYSTAFRTYGVKGKLGYDVTNGNSVFLGPVAAIYGDERSSQFRIGGHLTQMTFGRINVDIAVGYAHDTIVGDGVFTSALMSTRF